MNAALDDRHLLSTVATSTRNRRKKNKKHIGLSGQSIGKNPDVAHFSKNGRQEGHINFIENIVAILCNTCTCKQDDEELLQKNSFITLPPNDTFKTEKSSLHASTHSPPHTQVSKKNIYSRIPTIKLNFYCSKMYQRSRSVGNQQNQNLKLIFSSQSTFICYNN